MSPLAGGGGAVISRSHLWDKYIKRSRKIEKKQEAKMARGVPKYWFIPVGREISFSKEKGRWI
jgi:hypothetical protein